MRDINKSEEYFTKCINYEKERIHKFSQALANIEKENNKGRDNALMYLANFNKNLFKLSYSFDASIEDIYCYYEEWIRYYSKICTVNYSFYDIIDMFSIAVFYEKRKEKFTEYLTIIINKLNLDEGIVNLCLHYLDLDFKENKESKLSYVNDLLKSHSKDEDLICISKEWYKSPSSAYWYNTHKMENDTYCGYWSFELGAIVKILRLNDEELKTQQYYPYDLVHFNE